MNLIINDSIVARLQRSVFLTAQFTYKYRTNILNRITLLQDNIKEVSIDWNSLDITKFDFIKTFFNPYVHKILLKLHF